MRRLLLITSGDINKASTRVRVLSYVPLLEKMGWSVRVMPPIRGKSRPARLMELLVLLRSAIRSDVIMIQKRLFHTRAAWLFKHCSKRLIFEFDDPIFLDMTGDVNPWRQQRLKSMLLAANTVTVNNSGLYKYVSMFNPNTVLIPSCVDTTIFNPSHSRVPNNRLFVIGWIGHPSNLPCLRDIEPAFAALRVKYGKKVVLKVISSEPYYSNNIPVINKLWKLQHEPEDISSFDVGIVPLRDDTWTQYKMAFRPFLLMAMECPVILSPFGPNADVIQDGSEGFVAKTPEDWARALGRLVADPEMGRKMGKNGRRKVEINFTHHASLPKFLSVLESGQQPTGP